MNLSNRQVEHPYLDILAMVFVAVIVIGSILGFLRFQEVEKARVAFAQKQKNAAQTISEFDRVMRSRGEFLAVAAKTDATLAAISKKVTDSAAQKTAWDNDAAAMQASYDAEAASIKAHNDAENAKYKADPRYTTRDYWTLPSNPGSPAPLSLDFSAEIAALNANKADLSAFISGLKKEEIGYKMDETKTIFRDLYKSAEALDSAQNRNIEIAGGLVSSGKQGQVLNEAKADLLKYNSEDEWLKALRVLAVDFIKANSLELGDYDLPGGTDVNPADKSQL